MAVVVVLGTDILHLVDAAALRAALNRALAVHLDGEYSVSQLCHYQVREPKGSPTLSQMTLWESAGQPVQPAYCSTPAERTMMGSWRVPVP